MIEYAIRNKREHAAGGKVYGWAELDHERALLAEMGMSGWILCSISGETFYFYRIKS